MRVVLKKVKMGPLYILEYKERDSRGREKNSKHVGVFKTIDDLEKKKAEILHTLTKQISFQVYVSEKVF